MKTFFLFIVLATSLSLNAQITKDNWLVGGDMAFSYSKSKPESILDSETFNMNFSPNIGYFIWDKWALGLRTDFTHSKSKSDSGSEEFNRLLLSPFTRYYILKPEKSINPFLEGSYRFSLINESSSREFVAKCGVAIFLNSSVAFETYLSYLNTKSNNLFVGSHTVLLGIGIQVHLKKR